MSASFGERLVNICGVSDDPAELATAERLVASFVQMAVETGRGELAAGAAVALLCFTSPGKVHRHLHDATTTDYELMDVLVDGGMSEVADIVTSGEASVRLSQLTREMTDEAITVLMQQTVKKGQGSRTEALRATEELVMELMAK